MGFSQRLNVPQSCSSDLFLRLGRVPHAPQYSSDLENVPQTWKMFLRLGRWKMFLRLGRVVIDAFL